MQTADLFIIAAGNGSRIALDVPKALIPILGEPCITSTLKRIGARFRRVFVVTNVLVQPQWNLYFARLQNEHPRLAKQTQNLPITSGFGDGHATLQGLLAAERMKGGVTEEVVIVWGDVFFRHKELADELLSIPLQGSGLVPVVQEHHPYVSLLVDDSMQCISADFSKFGEHHTVGFHDQSVFRFVRSRLRTSLQALHDSLWRNGRYMAQGGELSLLYSFHELYNSGHPVRIYETEYRTVTFNTPSELSIIRHELTAASEQARILSARS